MTGTFNPLKTLLQALTWIWAQLKTLIQETMKHPWLIAISIACLLFICTYHKTPDNNIPGPIGATPHTHKPDIEVAGKPTVIIHGDGTVAVGDSILPVTLTAIEYSPHNRGIRVTVGQDSVVFNDLDWWIDESDWRAVGELSIPLDFGIGLAYKVAEIKEINLGPAAIIDTNLEWIALEARGWKYLTDHLSIDAGIGARFSDSGITPHAGIGIGLDL